MIREGKIAGWLTPPSTSSLASWISQHDVKLHGVYINEIKGNQFKGQGVLAANEIPAEAPTLLMTVPKRLILSKETVQLHAEIDHHLRQVLQALGEFGTTSRGAILTFLLMQSLSSCPAMTEKIGVASPFVDYIKHIPLEELPTSWSEQDLLRLEGTSLAPAVRAKMKSLHREYSNLQHATKHIDWCEKYWWSHEKGLLSFDDWLQVDAMYRSRALEFPGVGDSMVPCIDMANHSSGSETKALYETDEDGNATLLLRQGKQLDKDDEVTITYGDDKGACEMIFSYGFLEEDVDTARHIFLDLDIPTDDPLRQAKKAVSDSAPGVRVSEGEDGITWESDFVWLICVNEEDGLQFKVNRSVVRRSQLQIEWKDQLLQDTTQLRTLLQLEQMWPIYQLRAISIIQERVESQMSVLAETEQYYTRQPQEKPTDGSRNLQLATRLRNLEMELLRRVDEFLEGKKDDLLEDETVTNYLEHGAAS